MSAGLTAAGSPLRMESGTRWTPGVRSNLWHEKQTVMRWTGEEPVAQGWAPHRIATATKGVSCPMI